LLRVWRQIQVAALIRAEPVQVHVVVLCELQPELIGRAPRTTKGEVLEDRDLKAQLSNASIASRLRHQQRRCGCGMRL
jgi:hypothetical protein